MPSKVKVGSSWHDVTRRYRKVSGEWRAVKERYVKVGGVWRTVGDYLYHPQNEGEDDMGQRTSAT